MCALTANRDTRQLADASGKVAKFNVLNAKILYAGGMVASDYLGEVQAASDTLGLRVLGKIPLKVDNTSGGGASNADHGIFRYANSTTYAIARAMIGQVCYVEDDQTVAGHSANLVAAGIIFDYDSSGIWVDQTPAALAMAVRLARVKIVTQAAATYAALATQCYQGNVVLANDYATGATVTLPSAIAGYRIGLQRMSATAAHDLIITPNTLDALIGLAANISIHNEVDAVSEILWLETTDATNWVIAPPVAADRGRYTT